MVTFAHISDTHLGYRQFNLEERENDFYEVFSEAVDKIIEKKVDFVVHSGDLFEHFKSPPRTLLNAIENLRKLKEENIPIYSIPGNHDIIMRRGAIPPQALLSYFGVTLLGGIRNYIEHDGIFVGGIRYLSKYYSAALLDQINELSDKAEAYEKRILLLHEAVDRFLPFNFELQFDDLPRNFDYLAMGHIHKRIKAELGRGILAYAGSTEVWRSDEVSSFEKLGKGINIIDLDKKPPTIQIVDLETIRPFYKVEISTEDFDEELEKILKKIEQSKKKEPIAIIKIHGKGMDAVTYNRILEESLGALTLTYRVNFELTPESYEPVSIESLNFEDLFQKSIEDSSKAKFAYELFKLLSVGDTEQAIKFSETFFEEEWE
ncbi:MAG: exonuclease SbcCD subunit D [Candidatus Helarchaeota archaeon]|nr:exonuclease SbcCD subunit D [Candidatus Helarchaeota archaeon]